MPGRRSGPDPSQRVPERLPARPGDDSALGLQPAPGPDVLATPKRWSDWSDEEMLARPWRAEADHVGNWAKGKIIPSGVISDAEWGRELLRRGFISVVEDEA